MSRLSWLAGAAAIPVGRVTAEAAQTPASQDWDLSWIDDLKGAHMQVFDMADTDPAGEPPPLRLPRNYMDTFRDVYKRRSHEIRSHGRHLGARLRRQRVRSSVGEVHARRTLRRSSTP
ncbi:MAG: hypothetical protein QM736_09090 [Vicinamibacterales bacterium]